MLHAVEELGREILSKIWNEIHQKILQDDRYRVEVEGMKHGSLMFSEFYDAIKKEDDESLHEELEITIERYRAQGFDVAPLKDLADEPIDKIRKGIDDYRNALKKLNSAMTVLKSLEGYGYTKEIEAIIENIKNPNMADKVFQDAEALKERAFAEHNIQVILRREDAGCLNLTNSDIFSVGQACYNSLISEMRDENLNGDRLYK